MHSGQASDFKVLSLSNCTAVHFEMHCSSRCPHVTASSHRTASTLLLDAQTHDAWSVFSISTGHVYRYMNAYTQMLRMQLQDTSRLDAQGTSSTIWIQKETFTERQKRCRHPSTKASSSSATCCRQIAHTDIPRAVPRDATAFSLYKARRWVDVIMGW